MSYSVVLFGGSGFEEVFGVVVSTGGASWVIAGLWLNRWYCW